jgi:hypothetical protein
MIYIYIYIYLFLCHYSEYSCGFLHTVKIIHMGLKVYNAMMIFFIFFSKYNANAEK